MAETRMRRAGIIGGAVASLTVAGVAAIFGSGVFGPATVDTTPAAAVDAATVPADAPALVPTDAPVSVPAQEPAPAPEVPVTDFPSDLAFGGEEEDGGHEGTEHHAQHQAHARQQTGGDD